VTRLHIPIRLRWSDLDAYGHVNNAEMFRLFEEARIAAFWVDDTGAEGDHSMAILDGRPGADTVTIIARQEIEYLLPIPYLRAPLDVQLWLGRMGGSSLEICYEVWSPIGTEPRTLYAKAATTVVLLDAKTQTPRRITDAERAACQPYLDSPLEFRRS
jgi:acyl-CoA thioester hydrolase